MCRALCYQIVTNVNIALTYQEVYCRINRWSTFDEIFIKMKTVKSLFILCFALVGVANTPNAQTTTQSELDSLKKEVSDLNKNLGTLKNLKVTGWVQAQYQWTELKGTKNFDGGDFLTNSNNRFMIRRGRVKFTYVNNLTQFVLQINATERGLNLVDVYGKITDPWRKTFSFTAGVMNRPFGFEIEQSSQVRETPERSRFTQVLLPNERDLGAMVSYEPVQGSKLHGLKVDAGFYNGHGIIVPGTSSTYAWVSDFDNYKDFIGKARYRKSVAKDKINFGIGLSHYNGGFMYQSNNVYKSITTDSLGVKSWSQADTVSQTYTSRKAPRVYFGIDGQIALKSKIGTSTLRAEYVMGTQSGTINSTRSPAFLPSTTSTYVRQFNAGYLYFVQRIGKTRHEITLKYDWYDTNTKITGKDISLGSGMTDAELKYTSIGLGYSFYARENVKFMAYYNIVKNELTNGIANFNKDISDNILTLRMQYRF